MAEYTVTAEEAAQLAALGIFVPEEQIQPSPEEQIQSQSITPPVVQTAQTEQQLPPSPYIPNIPVQQAQSPYATPPAGYYISDYVNGQPVYSPINPSSEQPIILPTSPDYPEQPNVPPPQDFGAPVETGVFVPNQETGQTDIVPFEEYQPEESPGYVPTIENYQQNLNEYNVETSQFEQKWQPLVQDNTFIGTQEQFTQYQNDFNNLNNKFTDVKDYQERLVVQQEKEIANFETTLQKESPELYKVYKEQGYNAYLNAAKSVQDKYKTDLIQYEQQVKALDSLKLSGIYKDGQYDVVKYLRENPNDIESLIRAGFDIDEITRLNENLQASKGYWTEDNKLKAFDALVAGVLTQEQIEELTGTRIDTSKPPPLTEFGDIYYKSHPIISKITNRPLEPGANLQGIGMLNYPEFYNELRKKYNEIYGAGQAQKATARSIGGEITGAFFGQIPAKIIEPTYGTHTIEASDWVDLAIGVATISMPLWLPKVAALAPKLNPYGKVVLELKDGSQAKVWEGLKVVDNPIIGKTEGGKIVVGTKNLKFPEVKNIKMPTVEEGGTFTFEPRSGLETKILTNTKNLKSLGVTDEGILRIQETLPRVQQFYGKKSPYMNNEVLTNDIETLSSKGVETVFKQAIQESDIIDFVKHYGSSSIRPQLNPKYVEEWIKLRGHTPADIDIQLGKIGENGAKEFTKRLLKSLQDVGEEGLFIDESKPKLIMKRLPNGETEHAIDVHHLDEADLFGQTSTSSSAKEMVYGLSKSSPAVEVDIPGIGKVKIARLSESGIGKTEQVIGWRYNTETGQIEIKPAAYRSIKDTTDLYEIIKTYAGESEANTWAKAIGFDPDELAKLTKESIGDASWEFSPSAGAKVSSTGSYLPIVKLVSPSLIEASTSIPIGISSTGQLIVISPKLPSLSSASAISTKLPSLPSLAEVSPSSIPSKSIALPDEMSILSDSLSESPSIESSKPSDSISSILPSDKLTEIGSTSPAETSKPSDKSVSPPKEKSPIIPSVVSPAPPSKPTSTIPPSKSSPSPYSPYPPSPSLPSPVSPSPYVPYIPRIYPPKAVSPPALILPKPSTSESKFKLDSPITWRQGFVYWSVYPPKNGWKSEELPTIKCTKNPPYGASVVNGIGSAYQSIKAMGGNADAIFTIDMGAFDVTINRPSTYSGKRNAIKFKHDKYNMTTHSLTVKGVRTSD